MSANPLALWLNGVLLPTDAPAPFSLQDRGLTLSDGLFETLPALAGRPVLAHAHIARLCEAAEIFAIPIKAEDIHEALDAITTACSGQDIIIRLTLTRGAGGRGLTPPEPASPTLFAVANPYHASMVGTPCTLVTSGIRRNQTSPTSHYKTLAYFDAIQANEEAREQGADDALMLNTRDQVASATIGNIFAVRGEKLITPPLEDGVLDGITRALVLDTAAELGMVPLEESLTRDDLLAADAVFLTNSLRFIRPVTALDGVALTTNADPANLQDVICKKIAMLVGKDPRKAGLTDSEVA